MTTTPRRLEKRRAHLDAATVPVERALLARAADLQERARNGVELPEDSRITVLIAAEFRALAEELHWVA